MSLKQKIKDFSKSNKSNLVSAVLWFSLAFLILIQVVVFSNTDRINYVFIFLWSVLGILRLREYLKNKKVKSTEIKN